MATMPLSENREIPQTPWPEVAAVGEPGADADEEARRDHHREVRCQVRVDVRVERRDRDGREHEAGDGRARRSLPVRAARPVDEAAEKARRAHHPPVGKEKERRRRCR